jgi:uroporphyrinogen decarboxylase
MNPTDPIQHRLCETLKGEITDRPPIWLMRQAGRYLPEYRAIRSQVPDFMTLCKNTDLAVEITLQPLERFTLDAAIIFSDILTIPDAMGLGLTFVPGQGPVFAHPLQEASHIERLSHDVTQDLGYVFDAISHAQRALNHRVPLIGFSGSPWTLAAYMVEGRSSPDFSKALALCHDHPTLMHTLLQCLADNVIAYCRAQIEAGADVIMLFDSWGGRLPDALYDAMSLAYLRMILSALHTTHPNTPTILYAKVPYARALSLIDTQASAVGISHEVDLARVRTSCPNAVLQGNIDPASLNADTSEPVIQATRKCLLAQGQGPAIINLGHGIRPDARIENVHALIHTVHQYQPPTS